MRIYFVRRNEFVLSVFIFGLGAAAKIMSHGHVKSKDIFAQIFDVGSLSKSKKAEKSSILFLNQPEYNCEQRICQSKIVRIKITFDFSTYILELAPMIRAHTGEPPLLVLLLYFFYYRFYHFSYW